MADAVNEKRQPVFVPRSDRVAETNSEPVILFTAGGRRFAVAANQVEEIRDREERGAIHRLRGPELIDFAQHVGLGPGILERFVIFKPGDCALGVRDVERMTSLPKVVPLPLIFCGVERQWYRGLLLLENDVVPLVRTEYWRKLAVRARGVGSGR